MQAISIQYGVEMFGGDQMAKGAEGAGVGPAAASDTERFQQSMQSAGVEPAKSNDILATTQVGDAAGNTLGDKVLNGLQGMKSGFDSQLEKIQTSLADVNLTSRDMFRMQVDLATLSLQGELINKVVTKSTQNLDTLLKSQ